MSNVSTGRRFEERIANLLGASRQEKKHYGHSIHDVENHWLIGECKLRASLAVEGWMQQVEEHRQLGKFCVSFAKTKGLRDDKTIVCLRIGDFIKIMKEAGYLICRYMVDNECQDEDHDCPEGCCYFCEFKTEPCQDKCKEMRDGSRRSEKG